MKPDKNFVKKFPRSVQYVCTACGGDATVALSNFRDTTTGEYLIEKGERLCLTCAKKRNVTVF